MRSGTAIKTGGGNLNRQGWEGVGGLNNGSGPPGEIMRAGAAVYTSRGGGRESEAQINKWTTGGMRIKTGVGGGARRPENNAWTNASSGMQSTPGWEGGE